MPPKALPLLLTAGLTIAVVGIPVWHEYAGWPGVLAHLFFIYPLPYIADVSAVAKIELWLEGVKPK